MAEEKNNSQVSAAPQTEMRSPASQTTNGAAGNAAQSGKPAVSVNQSKSDRLAEINEQLKSDVLSIDQRAKLEQKKKDLENDAQGVTNEKKDNDIKRDDPDPKKFTEEDIIQYMYNKWLIDFFCWTGGKIEKAAGSAYDKLERRMFDKFAQYRADKLKAQNSNAYKTYKTVDALKRGASENIKRRDREQLKKVQDLATIIGEGQLNAPSAKIGNSSPLEMLAQMHNVTNADLERYEQFKNNDGIVDTGKIENPQHKAMFEILNAQNRLTSAQNDLYGSLGITPEDLKKDPKCKQKKLKELQKSPNPDDKELFTKAQKQQQALVEAQKELCKVGARFAQQEGRKIYFNSLVDQAAINMAEAQMLDKVARNGSAFEGKDLTETFKSMSEQNRLALNEATSDERANYVKGQNLKTIYPVSGMAPVQVNLPGTIERYNNMSQQASDAAVSNIAWFRIAEMGKQPRPNRALNNLEKMVDEQRRKHQPPTEEKLQESEQKATEEQKRSNEELKNLPREDVPQTPPPHNMEAEAADNQIVDKQQQARRASLEEEKSALTVRETQHAQRGSFLLSRINRIKYQKQQELIAEGRKNNFQGWKYMPRGQEM